MDKVLTKQNSLQDGVEEYPLMGIAIALLLLYASPFVSTMLVYLAFAICVMRILAFDEKVFAADYCVLSAVSLLFKTSGGFSLLVVLSIFAGIWYIFRNGLVISSGLVILILFLDYLLFRMQSNYGGFIICASQLILLYVLIQKQNRESVLLTAKLFCVNLFFSSVYALVFRNTSQIRRVRGKEVLAYFGSSKYRFMGLFEDANYYMVLVVIAAALLIVLRRSNEISTRIYLIMTAGFLIFGSLTYSKTFAIAASVVYLIIMITQLRVKKFFRFIVLLLIAVAAFYVALHFSNTPLYTMMYRFTSAGNMNDLTTGRSWLLRAYLDKITQSAKSEIFGFGLSQDLLQRGTHNLFLEITYYTGLVGLAFYVVYSVYLIRFSNSGSRSRGTFLLLKYIVLIMLVLLYMSLQGMFSVVTYAMFLLGAGSVRIYENGGEAGDAEAPADLA